jgi:hypothetical protein
MVSLWYKPLNRLCLNDLPKTILNKYRANIAIKFHDHGSPFPMPSSEKNTPSPSLADPFGFTTFRRFFTPPHLEVEENTKQAHLLRIVLFVAITLSLLTGVAVLFLLQNPLESLIPTSIILIAELICLWITLQNKIQLASFLMTFGLGAILLFITFAYGGVRQATYSSFVIVILSGGLLLGKRYIWITLLLGILSGALILFMELNHRLPSNELPDLGITWVANVFTFIWAGAILYIAVQNMEIGLRRAREEIQAKQKAYDTTLAGWSRALELRDQETQGHSDRVLITTVWLAEALEIRGEALDHLRRGALLHDIGKMGIPDAILSKPGPLNEDEWKIMRQHPVLAYYMLNPIEYLRPALDIPYYHHEKWDGTGYPHGLAGEQIPLAARIFAVVDVWDALCSDRPYRAAWSEEKALAYIRDQSGKQFDPHIVDVFLKQINTRNIQKIDLQAVEIAQTEKLFAI